MPTLAEAVDQYLGNEHDAGDVSAALAAEKAAQAARCRIPAEAADSDAGTWPADLLEALCRRVARNLTARGNPLGFIPTLDDTTSGGAFFGSNDPEIRRLEAPHRRLAVG